MRPKIYLFGDSITEMSFADGGWGASLTNHFCRTVDVVVRGYDGYNTRWALLAAEKVFPPLTSTLAAVTVFFGANDGCLPDRYGAFLHVPLDEYKLNLRSIVSFIKERWPNVVILLMTPPPIDEEARLKNPFVENPSGLPERTNQVAGEYAKGCVDVAKECGCPVVDLWTKMQQLPNWTSCLSDGLHLSQLGNKIVFEEVVKKLDEQGLSPETLLYDLPVYSDVDFVDPRRSFRD